MAKARKENPSANEQAAHTREGGSIQRRGKENSILLPTGSPDLTERPSGRRQPILSATIRPGREDIGVAKSEAKLRRSGEGFQAEEATYQRALSEATIVYKPTNSLDSYNTRFETDLRGFYHTIPWPVDMTDSRAHLTCFYGQRQYSAPQEHGSHNGIDIQLPLGSLVVAPADAVVVNVRGFHPVSDNYKDGLADVLLFSPNTGLGYVLGHLDQESIPEKIRDDGSIFSAVDPVAQVEAGEPIGRVGAFYSEHKIKYGVTQLRPEVKVPKDVAVQYGRSYNHLHFEIIYPTRGQNFRTIEHMDSITRGSVNPLLLLKRLY